MKAGALEFCYVSYFQTAAGRLLFGENPRALPFSPPLKRLRERKGARSHRSKELVVFTRSPRGAPPANAPRAGGATEPRTSSPQPRYVQTVLSVHADPARRPAGPVRRERSECRAAGGATEPR